MPAPVQPDHWVPIDQRLPEQHQPVLILVADPAVAIDARPTVAHLQIEGADTSNRRLDWWAGLPGKWQRLPSDGWIVTHWMPLPAWRDGHWMTRGTCLGTEDPGRVTCAQATT